MWGKEKRLGHLRALVAEINHPAGQFRAVTVHLDAHCSRAHRRRQMKIILDHLETLAPMPTLIGGDWNTTTFNSQNSTRAIMGYWRRVFMGPKRVATKHLPYPERYFERRLFEDLETRGFDYKSLNQLGIGTLHYHVASIEKIPIFGIGYRNGVSRSSFGPRTASAARFRAGLIGLRGSRSSLHPILLRKRSAT